MRRVRSKRAAGNSVVLVSAGRRACTPRRPLDDVVVEGWANH
ncbi:hypothetical protein JOD54_004120 [Actinokineospora baliensis]|nr:hypothetical protein [Actinokineospora baliensis]MBM7773916.1 hypothetical protein [Actinokineospora baliensis]